MLLVLAVASVVVFIFKIKPTKFNYGLNQTFALMIFC